MYKHTMVYYTFESDLNVIAITCISSNNFSYNIQLIDVVVYIRFLNVIH